MSNIKLDLKGFKYQSSDGKSTTLVHDKLGHRLTLAHNVLSPKNQEVLKALSKIGPEAQTADQFQEAQDQKPKKMAKGGMAKCYADGGGVDFSDFDALDAYLQKNFGHGAQEMLRHYQGKINGGQEDAKAALVKFVNNPTDTMKQMFIPQEAPAQRQMNPQEQQSHELAQIQAPQQMQAASNKLNAQAAQDEAAQQQVYKDVDSLDPSAYQDYQRKAEGGQINPNLAAKQQAIQAIQAKQSMAPVDPSLKAKKDLYNQILAASGAASSPTDMFGPNGETPQNPVNPMIWGQVENSPHLQQLTAQQVSDRNQLDKSSLSATHQAEHDAALAQNVVNSKVGVPLVPDPGGAQQPIQKPQPVLPKIQPKMAKGGKVNKYAEGDEVQPTMSLEDLNAALKDPKAMGKLPDKPQATPEVDLKKEYDKAAKGVGNYLMTPAGMPVPPVQEDQPTPQAEPEAQMPQEQPQQAPQQPDAMASGMDQQQGMMQAGYQSRLKGIEQQAYAQGALGQQQAQILDQQARAQQDAQLRYQKTYGDLESERQNHMDDIKEGYINPNKYWDNHSKIATGIGMILAGFNPTSNPNAAINFLKYQMDNNIKAQMENLGAKKTLLEANVRQFGNLRDATDMTRLMQNDIMQHELASAAATAQSPMAKAAALQAKGQLQMEAAPMFQQFAMRRALMGMAGTGGPQDEATYNHLLGYMRMMNPEQAKEMESRHVPGVGNASIPVPADVRGQLIAKQQFGDAVRDLQDWATRHSGSLSPTAILEGRTKAANVQNLYRQGINGGVFKQGEQSFINGIIDSDPTKFFNQIRILPKLNEASKENENSLNILKRGYGLPAAQPQQDQAVVTGKDGRQYRRVGNYMVPVK